MNISPAIVTVLGLLTTTLTAPAYAAPSCLDGGVGAGSALPTDSVRVPVLADRDTTVPIWVAGATIAACPDLTATVRKVDGTQQTTVRLDREQYEVPPVQPAGVQGLMPLRVRDGAGDWEIIRIADGAASRSTAYRFTILRGTVARLDQPRIEAGVSPTTVTGTVRRYTSAGTLAPAAGRTVRLLRRDPPPVFSVHVATVQTDATGRFSARVPLVRSALIEGLVAASGGYAFGSGGIVTAYRLLRLSSLAAAPTAVLGRWWKVAGTALPGNQWTTLETWNGSAWVLTQSFGPSAANGTFARYLRPTTRGPLRVRVSIGHIAQSTGLLNTPVRRELTINVTQPPARPTYLDGRFGPTAGPPVRTATMMSTFGHLRIRRADGTLGPMLDESVEVQTWARGDTGWQTRTGARTTATGYFYMNWDMPYAAGANVAVRVLYRAPYPTSLPSARILGTVIVR